MVKKDFRTKIELLLAEQNRTQNEIANKIGMSRQSFTNLKGRERHHPKTIHKLAKVFNVPCEYFLD